MNPDNPMSAAHVPLDQVSTRRLAERGLQYRSPSGEDEIDAYGNAVDRGFLEERATQEQVVARRDTHEGQRMVGVYDQLSPTPSTPIATTTSWIAEVTIDADSFLPMWSISDVTVASTHRRRGIARALLEGELRAAADAGLPIAGLTVSEATLYGRYGFGVAAHTGSWRIEARKAGWVGPRPTEGERPGRLDHIERDQLRDDLAELNEATRGHRPGDVAVQPSAWRHKAGLIPGKHDENVRGVRYTDAAGVLRGAVSYSVTQNHEDYPASSIAVHAIVTDGIDAYAALWRYLIEHDLIGTVTTSLRSLDEPLRWMVANQRAIAVTERDHHWLRILDVPRCLQARRLRVTGEVIVVVADDLGFADGAWKLSVDDGGDVTVVSVPEPSVPDGAATEGVVRLGVSELSSLLLGDVRASTLLAAGRLQSDIATAQWLDLAFTPITAPQLSSWY